jgi:hypothetical protein
MVVNDCFGGRKRFGCQFMCLGLFPKLVIDCSVSFSRVCFFLRLGSIRQFGACRPAGREALSPAQVCFFFLSDWDGDVCGFGFGGFGLTHGGAFWLQIFCFLVVCEWPFREVWLTVQGFVHFTSWWWINRRKGLVAIRGRRQQQQQQQRPNHQTVGPYPTCPGWWFWCR